MFESPRQSTVIKGTTKILTDTFTGRFGIFSTPKFKAVLPQTDIFRELRFLRGVDMQKKSERGL